MQCPDANTLSELVYGQQTKLRSEPLNEHLDQCTWCSDLLALLAKTSTDSQSDCPDRIAKRYDLIELLGAGAAADVYLATDTVLARNVALKIITAPSPRTRHRLLREAQTMAQLSHPNIVQVFDIGEFSDGVYISMEHVKGGTLTQWLSGADRSVEEITTLMQGVAFGLASAHQAGFVHRDFKPANILVDEIGCARIADFGLVGLLNREERQLECDSLSDIETTRIGNIVGTPAYMPLEQLLGSRGDVKSDQFSFCLTFYGCLYGKHPFSSESIPKLIASMKKPGAIVFPPTPTITNRLRKTLITGLTIAPEARHDSMHSLASELSRRTTRVWAIAAASTALALIAITLVYFKLSRPDVSCDATRGISADWDSAAQDSTRKTFERSGLSYASQSFESFHRRITLRDKEWREAWKDSCEATHVSGGQSEALMQSRMNCLEKRRQETTSLITLMQHADSDSIRHAARAIDRLGNIGECSDVEQMTLAAEVDYSPEDMTAVAKIEKQLAEASALASVGQFDDASARAAEAAALAESLGYPSLHLQALWTEVKALELGKKNKPALALIRDATELATKRNDRVLATKLWVERAIVLGREAEYEKAALALEAAASMNSNERNSIELKWRLEQARGLTAQLTDNTSEASAFFEKAATLAKSGLSPLHLADTLVSLGISLKKQGDFDAAISTYIDAMTIYLNELGPTHPRIAAVLHNLGNVQRKLQKYDQALESYLRGVSILEPLNPRGTEIAGLFYSLGNMHFSRGEYLLSEAEFLKAREIYERELPKNHPTIARTILGLARIARRRRQFHSALALAKEALAIKESTVGHDHISLAYELIEIGYVLGESGQSEEGIQYLQRALDIRTNNLGPTHPSVGTVHSNLGFFALKANEFEQARVHCEKARDIKLGLGTKRPALYPNLCLGEAQLGLGNLDKATSLLSSVIEIADENKIDGYVRAQAKFLMAQALMKSNPSKAFEFAKHAQTIVASRDDSDSRELYSKITEWLTEGA